MSWKRFKMLKDGAFVASLMWLQDYSSVAPTPDVSELEISQTFTFG